MPITIDLETHPFASKFFLKGRSEGRSEGRLEGRSEAKADMVRRQIQRRFGTVTPDCELRIVGASDQQLDAWVDHLMNVGTLPDDLTSGPAH